jgi:preprotein translocase subunit SecG
MQTILTVLHLFLALGLVGLVLIQHGKGADMGAAFGSGASATVFGARGSGNFLSRSTAVIATLFFVTSMVLAYFASQTGEPEGLMDVLDEVPAASTSIAPGEAQIVDEVPPPVSATDGGSDVPPPEPVPAPTATDLPPPAATGGAGSGAPAGPAPTEGQ